MLQAESFALTVQHQVLIIPLTLTRTTLCHLSHSHKYVAFGVLISIPQPATLSRQPKRLNRSCFGPIMPCSNSRSIQISTMISPWRKTYQGILLSSMLIFWLNIQVKTHGPYVSDSHTFLPDEHIEPYIFQLDQAHWLHCLMYVSSCSSSPWSISG